MGRRNGLPIVFYGKRYRAAVEEWWSGGVLEWRSSDAEEKVVPFDRRTNCVRNHGSMKLRAMIGLRQELDAVRLWS
jgi:hypothetical protein